MKPTRRAYCTRYPYSEKHTSNIKLALRVVGILRGRAVILCMPVFATQSWSLSTVIVFEQFRSLSVSTIFNHKYDRKFGCTGKVRSSSYNILLIIYFLVILFIISTPVQLSFFTLRLCNVFASFSCTYRQSHFR